jgi:membrane peptidoglycan carboxypeptidase
MARRNQPTATLDDLFPGATHPVARKPRLRRTRALVTFLTGSTIAAVTVTLFLTPVVIPPSIAARTAATWWNDLPTDLPIDEALPQQTVLVDRNGTPYATLFAENREPLTLDQIAEPVIDALLATEDDRFYEHGGIDYRGLARALANNAEGGSRQGGSTLTQQYVKNLLLTNATSDAERQAVTETSLSRKIREAKYAIALEQQLTKDEILLGYLNTVYFGDGAYGIGAAARHYFNKNALDLTIDESALLVGILKSPVNYDPTKNPTRAADRRNVVLQRMLATNRITPAEHAAAEATPLTLTIVDPPNGCAASKYPFYCQWVTDTILSDPTFGETETDRTELLYKGGLTITTALDPNAMRAATTAATRSLGATNRVAAGIAVIEPGTGHVAAIATNRTWGQNKKKGQTELVLPVLPAYQPGSTFKPITLATGVEQGFALTTRFDTPDGYKPANMNYPKGGFHNDNNRNNGVLTAYQATARSVNTWYVQLLERTGVIPVADMAERLGITSLPREGTRKITRKDASITLGSYEVSPLDMATVYATFAASGTTCRPTGILTITRTDNEQLPVPDPACHQAVDPVVADTVTDVLRAPFGPGGTASRLALTNRPAAGKTGTTNNSAATWFAGYTPQYATAVWIGDPRGGQRYPLKNVRANGTIYPTVYGSSIAGPIWQDVMNDLHRGLPVVAFPRIKGVVPAAPSVPDVRGLPRDAAITALLNAGYRVTIADATSPPDPARVPDHIASQTPTPGTRSGPGTTVTLVLTDGSRTDVLIPDLWNTTAAR